jgi:hypothetical protein
MGPEDKGNLLSPDPEQRAEQERAEALALSRRLIAESIALREKAKKLHDMADALMERFKRDHPDA